MQRSGHERSATFDPPGGEVLRVAHTADVIDFPEIAAAQALLRAGAGDIVTRHELRTRLMMSDVEACAAVLAAHALQARGIDLTVPTPWRG